LRPRCASQGEDSRDGIVCHRSADAQDVDLDFYTFLLSTDQHFDLKHLLSLGWNWLTKCDAGRECLQAKVVNVDATAWVHERKGWKRLGLSTDQQQTSTLISNIYSPFCLKIAPMLLL